MKKILPYILIFAILANIFAPFTLSINKGKIDIEAKQALSADTTVQDLSFADLGVDTEIQIESGPGFIKVTVVKRDFQYSEIEFSLFQKNNNQSKQVGLSKNIDYTKFDINNPPPAFIEFKDIPNGSYNLRIITTDNASASSAIVQEKNISVSVSDLNTQNTVTDDDLTGGTGLESKKSADVLPECVKGYLSIDIVGCAIVLYYNVLFVPTSYLFGLGGKFFDATFGYSIQDSSYRSSFVTEGWGIVRDFCNLFFIFILIYAAFGMILSIRNIKSKEIIINTILIGLLINFSLLAAQILVDSSNILTRVFYNSEAIKITVDKDGGTVDRGGINLYETTMGELPLSAALVSKIDPQNLILNADRVQHVDDDSDRYGSLGLTAGGWFLVITLAVIVNIVGFFVFLSVGLIFVARVIGLWFAMVFAPFAFFSYTVPQMQNIAMVGWKKWWPELLGLCFLAPLFMFFMYIILVFLEKGFASILEASNGPNFVLSIIIPFAFIMILLMTAKKLAKTYSGQMGQAITGAVTAAGAAALGGAALTTAWLGRRTIGATAKMVQNDGAREKALTFKTGDLKGMKALNPINYFKAGGKFLTAATAHGIHRVSGGSAMGTPQANKTKSYFQKQDDSFSHKEHASHILDDKAKSEFAHQYGKDVTYKDLKEVDQAVVKHEVEKDEMAKYEYGKKFKDLEAPEAQIIQNRYRGGERAIDDGHGTTTGVGMPGGVNPAGPPGARFGTKTKSSYFTETASASKAMGEFIQSLRKGSMDVRNLSQTKAVSKGILGATGVGLLATIAGGVRLGLKQGVGIEHGKGQKDVWKDLGHTITEAMKSVKINVQSGGNNNRSDNPGKVESVGH